ncbi:MAG: hypothetical protein K8R23_14640 [Chthoniobacter sp.]|nr:hypothetical protein [Chthoniobacter sp.]
MRVGVNLFERECFHDAIVDATGLPGVLRLAAECRVSKGAVHTALRILEKMGLLHGGGRGKSRRMADSGKGANPAHVLRVGIFLHERMDHKNPAMQSALAQLQHRSRRPATYVFSTQSQSGLPHDTGRVARYVSTREADAWVVVPSLRTAHMVRGPVFPDYGFRRGSGRSADGRDQRQQPAKHALRHAHADG